MAIFRDTLRAGCDPARHRARVRAITRRAWSRWQAAAGPWKGWNVCPLLCVPGADDIEAQRADSPHAAALATELAPTLTHGGFLVLLDLEPNLGVQVAARLNGLRLANAVLLEAGHFCQTFCLVATALGLAPFCSAALADSTIERDLGIDGVSESVLYACGVGTRPPGVDWAPWPQDRAASDRSATRRRRSQRH